MVMKEDWMSDWGKRRRLAFRIRSFVTVQVGVGKRAELRFRLYRNVNELLRPRPSASTGILLSACFVHTHHHLSPNREGRWGSTDDFTTSFLHFSLFSTFVLGRIICLISTSVV